MAAIIKMRVESAFQVGRDACVIARPLEKKEIIVSAKSRLGGAPLKPFLQIPRSIREDGTPDLEIFAFVLSRADDLPRFKAGDEVVFEEAV